MSILTKKERADLMARANQTILDSHRHPEQFKTWACEISKALDTIAAIEAERDALRTELQAANLRWTSAYEIATKNHNTRVVGGAHAALREILSVIEGVDEEGDK